MTKKMMNNKRYKKIEACYICPIKDKCGENEKV